jgi:hypothetical protein
MIIEFTRRFYVAFWKSYEGSNFHRPLSIRLLYEYLWAVPPYRRPWRWWICPWLFSRAPAFSLNSVVLLLLLRVSIATIPTQKYILNSYESSQPAPTTKHYSILPNSHYRKTPPYWSKSGPTPTPKSCPCTPGNRLMCSDHFTHEEITPDPP